MRRLLTNKGDILKSFIPQLTAALFAIAIAGCGDKTATGADTPAGDQSETASQNLLELDVAGMLFEGPDEIASGWTTIRLNNMSGMTHFALIYRLPDGVTAEQVRDEAANLFQAVLTAQLEGDDEKVAALVQQFPAWTADIVYLGGPGFVAGATTTEATMYLEPGDYMIECYVKTNGFLHNYNPTPGEFGMMHPLTVTETDSGAVEPDANVTIAVSSNGYETTSGAFRAGPNTVRVEFADQMAYGLVGHDAHIFRLENDTDTDAVATWMDFMLPHGQETPAPAKFVGGIHDMPTGSVGYFTADLAPGEYGMLAEIPDPKNKGLFTTFMVSE